MKYVNYPFKDTKRLSFYLATEEYLALAYPEDEYFFMWQVNPTVIFGRNQLIESEVNMDYVKANDIEFYRRKSGGGCVYADFSNVMFSFITPTFNRDFVFDTYLGHIVDVLKDMGLNAEFSGRNDIMVDGKKVSGNAFYRVGHRSVVHGTMLYDTDLSVMVKAITPSNEKLISKGVKSVRKRVTNLKDKIDLSLEAFKTKMRHDLCDEEIMLTTDDITRIEDIESSYLEHDFIYGKNPAYSIVKKARVGDAGEVEIALDVKKGVVKHINLLGDYFVIGDINRFLEAFKDVDHTEKAFRDVLKTHDVADYIYNLDNDAFLKLVFS